MLKKVLHPQELEHATGIIAANGNWGTAFLIASVVPRFCLTTSHNISGTTSIEVTFRKEGKTYKRIAEVIDNNTENDIALLKLSEPINEIEGLPLAIYETAYDEKWEAFGYPANRGINGGRINGTIARINEGEDWDIELECTQFTSIQDFSGFSGSALLINGFVVGVINLELAGALAATSLKLFKESLVKHNIVFQSFEHNDNIPESIRNQADDTYPNNAVLKAIDEIFSINKTSSYFLLKGTPGSGKTTLAAQYKPTELLVIDRYFIKVPNEEKIPTEIRATRDFFIQWLEGTYYRVIYNEQPPKSLKPLNERLQDVFEGLSNLSDYCIGLGKVGLFIIDGLDDIKVDDIEGFFSGLPNALPKGLRVLFSCTSDNILPKRLRSTIDTTNTVIVSPLILRQAEEFLTEHNTNEKITTSQISLIAQKSEGHPLYLRYLLNYINNLKNPDELGEWINNIPKIAGEIKKYYKNIWDSISGIVDEVWTTATLSRLRQTVPVDILIPLLPKETQYAFPVAFSKIKHLLKDNESISIYHSSFSDFINIETTAINNTVHHAISSYCLDNRDSDFSIANRVYHLISGDKKDKIEGIKECSQQWIDQAFIISINPEIILSDITKTKSIAASFGLGHELIRILLLAERVNFRYNNLFSHSASGFYLITALLTLNKYDEALRYIIRNDVLTVEDNEALYFLQKFYEYGAMQQAEEILDAIRRTCTYVIEKGLNEDSFKRFINLKFRSITLSANSDPKRSFNEFNHVLKITEKILRQSGNPESAFALIKDDVGSYNIGYHIWAFNIAPNLKEMEEKGFIKPDKKHTGFLSRTIIAASHFEQNSNYINDDNTTKDWVKDLEYAVEKYGVDDEDIRIVVSALLETSERYDIVEQLIKRYIPKVISLDLREVNKVDINNSAINKFSLHIAAQGYIDVQDIYPEIPNLYSHYNWEDYLKSLIACIWFISGKAHRLKAEHKLKDSQQIIAQYKNFINRIDFGLEQRMYWDRAYGIPESVMPIIYTKLVNFLVEFHPEGVKDLVDPIVNNSRYQLGLYTEGYIESLFSICRTLSKYTRHFADTHCIAKVVETHILNTVQNRWDRTEYLLRLIEIYAQIENQEKANQLFAEMMNTSMGPSWYKEAQIGIINTVCASIKLPDSKHIRKFAAHLDFASGEMTFQRYVKQQQEDFVGNLTEIGRLDLALDYFKYLILPDHATILNNAESGLVDMATLGNGYVLGAKAIEEQAAVLSLITAISESCICHPYVIWAFTELFIPGDTRYLRSYGKVQAQIFNYVEQQKPSLYEGLMKRLVRFTIADVPPENAHEYLSEFARSLSSQVYYKVKRDLLVESITLPKPDERDSGPDERDQNNPLDKLKFYLADAKQYLRLENKSAARMKLVEGLKFIQTHNYNVWSRNTSSKIDSLVDLLSDVYEYSEDLMKEIEPLITNEPYQENWVTANRLIEILNKESDLSKKESIVNSVEEHINLMVRTPSSVLDKYDFIITTKSEVEEEILLVNTLIWLLNHPCLTFKNRVSEILIWLGTSIPEVVISLLVQEVISTNNYSISKELSASILHGISYSNNSCFWKYFEKHFPDIRAALERDNHFMIKNSIIEALAIALHNGHTEAEYPIEILLKSFPTSTPNPSKTDYSRSLFRQIREYLKELDTLNIVDNSFIAEIEKIVNQMLPLQIEEVKRVDRYIDRSFNNFNKVEVISDFQNILRYALNICISKYVKASDRRQVAKVLRFYQPTFPELQIIPKIKNHSSFLKSLKTLFSNELISLDEIKLPETENAFLHFYCQERIEGKDIFETFGILAELIPANYTGDVYELYADYSYYKANDYPENIVPKEESDFAKSLPMIIESEYEQSIGCDLLPSCLIGDIPNYFSNFNPAEVHFDIWRNGRIWDKQKHGTSIYCGYTYSMSKELIKSSLRPDYKLIWKIVYNQRTLIVDFISNKIYKELA